MAVAAKVRKPRPGVGARQEDNNEDDRFLNGTLPSPRARRAASKALRDQTRREDHGKWKPSPNRRDPVDLLIASNEGRTEHLVPIRHGRMLTAPFAFLRDAAAVMAADLAKTPASGMRVQTCGD